MTIRTHYSEKPVAELHAKKQVADYDAKPRGFWYGVDDDWKRWCEDEGMEHWLHEYLYEVTLGEERMLYLSGSDDIMRFTDTYGYVDNYGYGDFIYGINWGRVAEVYDGIEIAPYCWVLRFNTITSWYYTWDCASGVIWKPKGASVSLVRQTAPQVTT